MEDCRLYALAGLMIAAILPFNYLVLERTNQRLLALSREKDVSGQEVRILIARWKGLNFVRSAVLAAAAGVGLHAVLR